MWLTLNSHWLEGHFRELSFHCLLICICYGLPHFRSPPKALKIHKPPLKGVRSTIWREMYREESFCNTNNPPFIYLPIYSVFFGKSRLKGWRDTEPSKQDLVKSALNFSNPAYWTYFQWSFFFFFFQNQRKLNSWSLPLVLHKIPTLFYLMPRWSVTKYKTANGSKMLGKLNCVQGVIKLLSGPSAEDPQLLRFLVCNPRRMTRKSAANQDRTDKDSKGRWIQNAMETHKRASSSLLGV